MAALAPVLLTKLGVAAGTASTIGTVLNVGLTAASAFSSISAGNQQAAGLELQARQADANARLERIQGREEALRIQDQLERDLSSQNALFGARGVLEGEGSAQAAQDEAGRNASRDIDLALFNSDIAALNAEQRASNARANASSAKSSGVFGAIKSFSSFKPIEGGLLAGVGK